MKGYPIFLNDLDQRRAIVIGGGAEAARKVRGLLACDANVTVICGAVSAEIQALASTNKITWIERDYQTGDLKGAFLVIADGADATLNAPVYAEAEAEGILVNVMDDVPHCSFVAGSVVRSGPLTIAISTSGTAPAYSVRLRQRFQREFDAAHGEFLQLMERLREPMARYHFCFQQRRVIWYEMVDSDLFDLLRAGDEEAVYNRIAELAGHDVVAALKAGITPPHDTPTHTFCEYHCKVPQQFVQCPFEQAEISHQ